MNESVVYENNLDTKFLFSFNVIHFLYADDTQLFSFHPRNSIAHLQTALQQISSWVSANIEVRRCC